MTLPVSGTISASQINTELQQPATSTRSLGGSTTRTLAGVASGAITFSNLHGKTYSTGAGGTITYGNTTQVQISGCTGVAWGYFPTSAYLNPDSPCGSSVPAVLMTPDGHQILGLGYNEDGCFAMVVDGGGASSYTTTIGPVFVDSNPFTPTTHTIVWQQSGPGSFWYVPMTTFYFSIDHPVVTLAFV